MSISVIQKELKLYVYHREMTPGALRNAELEEAMSKSRKIIILMSNSYIKSGECKFEAGKAGMQLIQNLNISAPSKKLPNNHAAADK